MAKNQTQSAETETSDAPKAAESKDKAFVRIVSRRMSNALSAIKLMEGNANPANYIYTKPQYERMIASLRNQVNELEAVYVAGGKQAAAVGFGFEGEDEVTGDDADESDNADENDQDE